MLTKDNKDEEINNQKEQSNSESNGIINSLSVLVAFLSVIVVIVIGIGITQWFADKAVNMLDAIGITSMSEDDNSVLDILGKELDQ